MRGGRMRVKRFVVVDENGTEVSERYSLFELAEMFCNNDGSCCEYLTIKEIWV